MKVQLIQPTTGEYRSNSRSGSYPPLGLVSIATFIKQECPFVDVEVIDGELMPEAEIIERLDGDIVALNSTTVTYPQAIKIAAIAKERGSKVVLGGVYASALPELILNKRDKIIDTLMVGYGEKPLVDIINGNNKKLVINHKPEFNVLPYPDRSFINLESYINVFQLNHPTWNYRATNIFTNVGCDWREKSNGGCIFCSRSGLITMCREPKNIWKEIRELVEDYQIDYIVDFSDSIFQNKAWINEVVRTKPKDLNPQWHVFARADEINRNTLELVKKLPCKHIFMGIESGDISRYKTARKGGGSPSESICAAKLLREFNIGLTPSYVIGLPGENEESLQKTLEHARRLHEITGFEEIFCCQLIPFPGSVSFNMLKNKVSFDSDIIDIEYLKKMWADYFCPIDFQLMEEYTHKILGLGKYKITISKNIHLDKLFKVDTTYLRTRKDNSIDKEIREIYTSV